MGICVEPLEEAMALWAPFEQFIYCTAAEREGHTPRLLIRVPLGSLMLNVPAARGQSSTRLKNPLANIERTTCRPIRAPASFEKS